MVAATERKRGRNIVKGRDLTKIAMTNYAKIQMIADKYGYDAQSRQCIEEMAELTQAINKFWRKRRSEQLNEEDLKEGRNNLIEEIADVQIMLLQMEYLLSASSEVVEIIGKKLNRQLDRIKENERNI